MPETFTPVTLSNDTGQKLNAAYFNRLEANIEVVDDRLAAQELGALSAVAVGYAASVTINAGLGGLFRCFATGDLTVVDIAAGTDGQEITFEVMASGADRVLSFNGGLIAPVPIQVNQWWIGKFRYNAAADTWLLIA